MLLALEADEQREDEGQNEAKPGGRCWRSEPTAV
jgi:hypothetical protein